MAIDPVTGDIAHGPSRFSTSNQLMTPSYIPISCDFHDVLEALATSRQPAQVRFRDEDGVAQDRYAVLTDVYSSGGAEYLAMDTGEIVRLDRLLAVDATRVAWEAHPDGRGDNGNGQPPA